MAFEIVSFPIENGDLHSYVSLPEGISTKLDYVQVYQIGGFKILRSNWHNCDFMGFNEHMYIYIYVYIYIYIQCEYDAV